MNRLARLDRSAENVRIQTLVIPKFKLVDVQMQVLLADFVEGPDDPALHDGPEAFDSIGMDCLDHLLPLRCRTSTIAAISHMLEIVASSIDMLSRVGRSSLI
jgi:hypothetical protein